MDIQAGSEQSTGSTRSLIIGLVGGNIARGSTVYMVTCVLGHGRWSSFYELYGRYEGNVQV
jgi:hypothetical protein